MGLWCRVIKTTRANRTEASYLQLAAHWAVVMWPYDVSLMIFYEFYSMGMPLFLPTVRDLKYMVFRGLHSNKEYHLVRGGSRWIFPHR